MSRVPSFKVGAPPKRSLFIYDGDCRFCKLVVERWRTTFADRVDVEPAQSAAERFPEIPRDAFDRAVWLITPDGDATGAAAAVMRGLAVGRGSRAWWWLYRRFPPFAAAAEAAYRFVARHRSAASRATRFLWGRSLGRPTFRVGSDLFLRALGLVYIVAFVSLGVQVAGLAGEHGIQPVARVIDAAGAQGVGFDRLPTLCLWLGASDGALHALCFAGAVCGALLLAGLVPMPAAAAAWLLYLSLCTPIVPFMSFQWDALLLEAGLLGIFLPPPAAIRLRWGRPARPSRLARLLLVWLLFRLMFSSGLVKLTSGDPSWADLTALTYHYWTQPLPPWTAWYLAKLPLSAHQLSCLVMFLVELGAPLLLFLPRRPRHLGGASIVALMIVIAASGNYGFFNPLTVGLCLLLFDDSAWSRLGRPFRPGAPEDPGRFTAGFRRAAVLPLVLIFALSWVPFGSVIGVDCAALYPLYRRAAPFRSVNGYGLFAVMTKTRDEIMIQGSNDGVTWKDYEFRWKPGSPLRRPRFCIGHMPRLDWQMWFAALSEIRGNSWLVNTLQRILEGRPEVLALFDRNPFPEGPPRFARAVAQPVRFTTIRERRKTGAWWKVEGEPSTYCPALRLSGGRLTPAAGS